MWVTHTHAIPYLFLKSKGELAENPGHYTMDQIFESIVCKQMYGELPPNATEETEKKQTKAMERVMAKGKVMVKVQRKWLEADFLCLMAPAQHEVPLANFFNKVLRCAKDACSMVEYKWVHF